MSQNYSPDWIDLGTVNGQLYGIVFKGANKSTVWYNVKAFQAAGVQPPKTWPDLLKAAKTLQASGVKAYSIGGADGWTLTDLFENIYLRTAGPDMYDKLTNHQIPWTDPSVTTALQAMAQILGDTGNIAGGTSGALQTDFPTSVTNVFSTPPKAAMVFEGDFVQGVITSSTKAKAGTDFNQFAVPVHQRLAAGGRGRRRHDRHLQERPRDAGVRRSTSPRRRRPRSGPGSAGSPRRTRACRRAHIPTRSRATPPRLSPTRDLPLRHVRPDARRVRRHRRPG